MSVRDWPYKSTDLYETGYYQPGDALTWLWHLMNEVADNIALRFPHHVPNVDQQYRAVAPWLDRDDMACQWGMEKPDGSCVIAAIVAVWNDREPLPNRYRKNEAPGLQQPETESAL